MPYRKVTSGVHLPDLHSAVRHLFRPIPSVPINTHAAAATYKNNQTQFHNVPFVGMDPYRSPSSAFYGNAGSGPSIGGAPLPTGPGFRSGII